ncbi:MAG: NAD regulator [Alphaproteobacteria bacterium]
MADGDTRPLDGQTAPTDRPARTDAVVIGLNAVAIVVTGDTPKVLVVRRPYAPLMSGDAGRHHFVDADDAGDTSVGLPFGPFDPDLHRTLEIGLRSWVEEQTHLRVEYVEQLYTFGDRGRFFGAQGMPRVISVGYLALTREVAQHAHSEGTWESWYRYFPWEDWRAGEPGVIAKVIRPRLEAWALATRGSALQARRLTRIELCFGLGSIEWDEEKVLERYELLYEAGLVAEAHRDRQDRQPQGLDKSHPSVTTPGHVPPTLSPSQTHPTGLGDPMQFDHRRVLATAIGRLRGKLKYRPVVFELMPETFTLLELQRMVEAIAGIRVHKQNFRRMVERSGLVEGTGQFLQTGGRPAEAFRFRRAVLKERAAIGISVSRTRGDKPSE